MNNRRSFLKMLGLGAVAAPAAVQALQVEAAPVLTRTVPNQILETQREINRRHSEQLAHLYLYRDGVHTHTFTVLPNGKWPRILIES